MCDDVGDECKSVQRMTKWMNDIFYLTLSSAPEEVVQWVPWLPCYQSRKTLRPMSGTVDRCETALVLVREEADDTKSTFCDRIFPCDWFLRYHRYHLHDASDDVCRKGCHGR